MTRLFGYVRPHVWLLGASLVLVAVVGALEAVSPFLIGLVFDTVLHASSTPTIAIPVIGKNLSLAGANGTFFLILLVLTTSVKAVAEYGSILTTTYLGQAVVRDLRNDLFDRILFQPLRFFEFNPTGDLISRVSADVERIQTAASETLAEFLKQSAILIFLLVAIFVIDWKLAAASIALVPLVFYPTVWFSKRLRLLSRSNQQEMADMSNVLYETIAGNRIVKAFTMEKAESDKFRKITQRIFGLNIRQKMTHALSSPMMEVLGVCVVAAFLVYARTQIIGQRMTPGLFVAFIVALIKLYDPVRRISGINNSFQQASGASGRIFEIIDFATERDTERTAGSRQSFEHFRDRIDFQSVGFAYNASEPVLEDVSFSIGKGEVLAVVGPSGAGKSTLVNLIPRFHEVRTGRILIDGEDLRQFDLMSLRKQVAIVTQDVILFNDTIRANIAYGQPGASNEAVMAAARAALVDDFVASFPEGYETRIAERGLRLSGGERQRISIARALLKNAPILILDEATSSLDSESEASVQQALQNLMQGRTTIVIAHRLSTIRHADRIVVLDGGRVKEIGTHEELIVRRGLYSRLLSFQEAKNVGKWVALNRSELFMIYSMTGFGSSRVEGSANLTVLVEIKSVNHRYIDVHVKIPGEYQAFENVIRQKLSSQFKRGRLDVFVRIDYKRENIRLDVNHNLIRAYSSMMTELKKSYPIQGDFTLEMMTKLPGLVTISTADLSADEIRLIEQKVGEAVDNAAGQLRQMRITEGHSLMADIDKRNANIARHLDTILSGANSVHGALPAAVDCPGHRTRAATGGG